MLIAKMETMLIFTDNSGLLPETYVIETTKPIDEITITTKLGTKRTLKEEVEYHPNIISLTEALKSFKIKCAIIRIDETTICHNTIYEED